MYLPCNIFAALSIKTVGPYLLMSYRAYKPYGRRRTDGPLSADERRRLELIRRDIDEDQTGMIRRYMRLASKVLGEGDHPKQEQRVEQREQLKKRVA